MKRHLSRWVSSALPATECGSCPARYNDRRNYTLTSQRAKLPRFVWQAVVLSLALQVAAIGLLHQYRTRATDNQFGFGWEMGCIGRAIAEGEASATPTVQELALARGSRRYIPT